MVERCVVLVACVLAFAPPVAGAAVRHHHHGPWPGQDGGEDGTGFAPFPQDPTVPIAPAVEVPTTKTVAGKVALERADGKAAIPRGAPKAVRSLITGLNTIVGKPYRYGGGHARLRDTAYDCSGTVSFGLIHAGLLHTVMVSGSFSHWGAAGAGRWVTTYSTKGHVYMEVAGLRIDTSAVADPEGGDGRAGARPSARARASTCAIRSGCRGENLGLSRAAIKRRTRAGRLHPMQRGVHSVVPPALGPRGPPLAHDHAGGPWRGPRETFRTATLTPCPMWRSRSATTARTR